MDNNSVSVLLLREVDKNIWAIECVWMILAGISKITRHGLAAVTL